VAAGYAGICGTPAIFPCRLRASLLNLQGERGAKSIIDNAPSVSVVDMPNAEFDVDTLDDLENLKI
jgi:CTP:molybdopterin cytidylyltransferase MocA